MDFVRPDRPSRCTWKPDAVGTPHTQRTKLPDRNKALPDILTAIGKTPLVKLNNIPKTNGIKCDMFAKCEFFNPGGSIKDRIAYRMVQDAEDNGLLKLGCTIIEPTSGNTGIGLAMVAAVRGYRCIIVMPEKMSNEKVYALRALGAEIVRTPTEASWDSPEAHINVAQQLQRKIPNSIILDQYTNGGNPLAHYDQTAAEIWEQSEGKVDYLIIGAGTGGTVAGIGRKFKELSPETEIIAVDPKGSTLAEPAELNEGGDGFYEVEGIGYDFRPTVLDYSVVDKWMKIGDHESLNAARMLIRKEGLLCGGSSGTAFAAALQVAKDLPEGKRVVVILPDGIRNYMTKFVSDHWMETRGFLESKCEHEANKWWWSMSVSDLTFDKPSLIKHNTVTCRGAIDMLESSKHQQLLVSNDGVHVQGVVVSNAVMKNLISGAVKHTDFVEKTMVKQFAKVTSSTQLGRLSRILEQEPFAVVFDNVKDNAVVGIINQSNLFNFITRNDAITSNHTSH